MGTAVRCSEMCFSTGAVLHVVVHFIVKSSLLTRSLEHRSGSHIIAMWKGVKGEWTPLWPSAFSKRSGACGTRIVGTLG